MKQTCVPPEIICQAQPIRRQINIQLKQALSGVTGVTGQAILLAIVAGGASLRPQAIAGDV